MKQMKKSKYVPQQIELWYLIPALRKRLSKLMVEKGLKQKHVAERLRITEAAVSQYVRDKRGGDAKITMDMDAEIRRSADRIMKGTSSMKEIQRLCSIAKEKRLVCQISKDMGLAPKDCKECY